MENTFLKGYCIKLEHTNDPDQTGPRKSYIHIYRVIFLNFFLFFELMEKYFVWCYKVPALQEKGRDKNTTSNPPRKLLWMGPKNNEVPPRRYFYTLQLHPCTGTKRHKGWNFRGINKMSLEKFCKAMQINLLKCFTGGCFWKIYWKKFAAFLVNFLVNFF